MSQTIVEKIVSKAVGRTVYAGEEMLVAPDIICAYDYPGYIDVFDQQMKELGITEVKNPEKFELFIDHLTPAGNASHAALHNHTREFGARHGIRVTEGKGIGHQVLAEQGRIKPGIFAVHFDGHVSTLGSLGAFCLGIRNSMIEVFATQEVSLVVPSTTRIEFEGKLNKGVAARDVVHSIIAYIGPGGASGRILEFGGSGLKNLNMDDRFTLCNLAMFSGAISAVAEQDEITSDFLTKNGVDDMTFVRPDENAIYHSVVKIDLSSIEPILVAPPSPANTVTVESELGRKIDVGIVASCASGRLTDIAQLCEVLKGQRVHDDFRLHVVPTSLSIQKDMVRLGYMEILLEAGARVHSPTCDFCYGLMAPLAAGETALATVTLNTPGRLGSDAANIYTASPYTIAASAINGYVTSPQIMIK